MGEIKIKHIGAVVAMALVFSIYIGVNAKETKVEPVKRALVTTYRWYEVVPTTDSNPSNQQLATGTPMSTPPPQNDEESCARENEEGEICAVLIEFEADESTSFTLPQTDVASAINAHADAQRIATGVLAEDGNGDGYSKSPEE